MKGFDARQTGQVVASSNDISLVIDPEGEIIDIAFGDNQAVIEPAADWMGQQWIETVTIESRPKIRDLLAVKAEQAPSAWRQVNHPSLSGNDIPVLYRVLTRDMDGHLIVVGRDLRPMSEIQQQLMDLQHSMEQDFALLRQAEKRYRVLFTLAAEGILIIDADSRRVMEANPAAGEMLDRAAGKMVGRTFPRGFTDTSEDAIDTLLNQVRVAGSADDIVVRTLTSDKSFNFGATLLKREEGTFFLARISPTQTGDTPPASRALLDVVKRSPDAFVVTDPNGLILTANDAFLELCQVGSEQQVQQQPLERWIGRIGVDVEMLRKNLMQRSQVRQFATTLKPEFEEPIDIEMSGVAALDADVPCLGFVIRHNIKRTTPTAPNPDEPFSRSLQEMTELIGRVPMKDLVRETSDIIERLCIEAALRATNDNRASAAELLGLSRQSLYVKLRRYGLEDFSVDKKD